MGNAAIDGRTMWEATTRCLLAHFDRHVRGVPAPSLEDLAGELSEPRLGRPRVLLEPTG